MREEVLIARRIGLNAIRTHVKVELPRKLYWADRLGVLVMSDVPNSWGEPDAAMKKECGDGFPRHAETRLQPPVDLLVGAVQRAVGPAHASDRREEGVPARDAGVGRDDLPTSRRRSTRRGSSRTTRPAARPATTSRPTSTPGTCTCRGGSGRKSSTRPRPGRSRARTGTTWAAAASATSRCSTASAATSGATRARRATSTGASTTTRCSTSSGATRRRPAGSTPSTTT